MDKALEEPTPVGSVISVARYPVKSMLGEEVDSSFVTRGGLLGDRCFALIDKATGKVVSAKNPKKWGRLFECQASFLAPPREGIELPAIRMVLPDGNEVTSDDAESDDVLSKALGAEVSLTSTSPQDPSYEEYWPDIVGRRFRDRFTDEPMQPHGFFDAAPVHVLTTATTDRLHELYPEGLFAARRFRPNIVVKASGGVEGFVEDAWIGRTLHIGEVSLLVTEPCRRCVMTTLAQGDLPSDLGILRTAARFNQVKVGIYATVEKGGKVGRTDPVLLE